MDNTQIDWHQFWEHTREMLDRGEIPGGEFYEKLANQATSRAITYEEFYYLLGRFPALVICHPDAESSPYTRNPRIIKSRSGWEIKDFGDWLCTSPGRLLWGPYSEGSPDDYQREFVKGSGTLVQQYVDAAYDVISLAVEKNWPGAKIRHGFYGMIRAGWIAAEALQFHLDGFAPTVNDQVVLSWVRQLLDKRQKEVINRAKSLRVQMDRG